MTNAAFKLEDSGFSREQVDALSEFMDGSVATKADIERLDGKITAEIAGLNGRINLVYWMLGVSVAGIVSLVIKAFTTF